MSATQERSRTRLENDDERYCKWCGWELPDTCFEHDFHPLGETDEPPELCGSCLADEMLYGKPQGERTMEHRFENND